MQEPLFKVSRRVALPQVLRNLECVVGLDRAAELAQVGAWRQNEELTLEETFELATMEWRTLDRALLILNVQAELVVRREVMVAQLAHVLADVDDFVYDLPVSRQTRQVVNVLRHRVLLGAERDKDGQVHVVFPDFVLQVWLEHVVALHAEQFRVGDDLEVLGRQVKLLVLLHRLLGNGSLTVPPRSALLAHLLTLVGVVLIGLLVAKQHLELHVLIRSLLGLEASLVVRSLETLRALRVPYLHLSWALVGQLNEGSATDLRDLVQLFLHELVELLLLSFELIRLGLVFASDGRVDAAVGRRWIAVVDDELLFWLNKRRLLLLLFDQHLLFQAVSNFLNRLDHELR